MCRMVTAKSGVYLPDKYWSHPDFKSLYIRYIAQANQYIKQYGATATIRGLRRKDMQWLVHFPNKRWAAIFRQEKKRLEQVEKKTIEIEDHTQELPRTPVSPQTKLSKLRELDD